MNTKENDSKLVPEVQRQYSLLREFNLEQTQAGDEILSMLSPSYSYKEVIHEVKFKGVTSNLQEVFVEDEQGEGYCRSSGRIKMKPLCWIDGKPVYKGDKLWYKSKADNTYYQQEAWSISGERLFDEGSFGFVDISLLSWDKPPEPHVHQDLIDAFEGGAQIEQFSVNQWRPVYHPLWSKNSEYRIKPQKKSGWINLWKSGYNPVGVSTGCTVYTTKEDALLGLDLADHVGAIEIHWEE